MKFAIILFLVAALGSSDILVSSQHQPSPAIKIKKAGHWVNLRGSLVRQALLKEAINSPDSADFHLGFDQQQQLSNERPRTAGVCHFLS
jgi:hypothetical protein